MEEHVKSGRYPHSIWSKLQRNVQPSYYMVNNLLIPHDCKLIKWHTVQIDVIMVYTQAHIARPTYMNLPPGIMLKVMHKETHCLKNSTTFMAERIQEGHGAYTSRISWQN
jgi:hypothetical protein